MALLQASSGSYEGSLFGWQLYEVERVGESDGESDGVEEVAMEARMAFGFHVCPGSLRTVATSASGKYLVCGGTDEVIRIFDMQTNKSCGDLAATHQGSITALQFYADSMLLSGSDDCTICIWRMSDWSCLHILGGHKKGITGLAIHPSGKVALSVSKDNTMKMWNLVEGRIAFTRRLKGSADAVHWDPSGRFYLLVMSTSVVVHAADTNDCVLDMALNQRVNSAVFAPCTGDWRVVAVCDNKSICVHDSDMAQGKSQPALELPSEHGRPKAVACTTGTDGSIFTSVVTSSGVLMVFDDVLFRKSCMASEEAMCALFSIGAQPRLTCLTTWTAAATEAPDSSKHKIKAVTEMVEEEEGEDVEIDTENVDSGDSEEERRKEEKKQTKKTKKTKKKQSNKGADVAKVSAGGAGKATKKKPKPKVAGDAARISIINNKKKKNKKG